MPGIQPEQGEPLEEDHVEDRGPESTTPGGEGTARPDVGAAAEPTSTAPDESGSAAGEPTAPGTSAQPATLESPTQPLPSVPPAYPAPTAEVPAAGTPVPVVPPPWSLAPGSPAPEPNGPLALPVPPGVTTGDAVVPPPILPPVAGPYGVLPPAPAGGTTPAPSGRRSGGTWRWAVVALVAALVGAGVGGVIVAAVVGTGGGTTTVKEISAGPALINGTANVETVIAKVLPAVVAIDAKSAPTSTGGFDVPGAQSQGQEDQGSGMIITSSGEVVTNNHVIAGATTITVTLYGQTKALPATLVDTDPTNDVALLQITGGANLPTVNYADSDDVQVGDGVVAIGNALGLSLSTPTVTQGIISAKGRTVTAGDSGSSATETLTDMFQTDAAINPGNSGGPLVDSSGRVIAMNTAVAADTSGTSEAQDIGFAIPANKIQNLLPGLRNHSIGSASKSGSGFLGVSLETVTPQLRSAYGFVPTKGAVVTQVESGSPADKAGLQIGDVIVSLDGKTVNSADQLAVAIQGDKPGQSVTIGLYRGQNRMTVTADLIANPSGSS
jgi:S1-C subfamily serine protease